jgi:hypothetical protein
MPVVARNEAIERLAKAAEAARADELGEIHSELFPDRPLPDTTGDAPRLAAELARHIRAGLEDEELVDLWNVVFPAHRAVHFDEEQQAIRFNEFEPRYAE